MSMGGPSQGSTGPRAVIRLGSVADAGRAGDLHASQISGGFLSFLGPRFLARLYARIVRWPSSFLLVAEDHGQVVGFIAGSDDVRGLYRAFLLHDGFGAAVTTAPRLLRGWRRMLETLRHGTGTASGTGRGVELLAVAVDPDDQGRGIGADLVDAFLTQVRADSGHAAYVVVESANASATALYRRAGFEPASEFELHAGTRSLMMQWDDDGGALDEGAP